MAYNPNFSRDPRGNYTNHANDSFVSVVGGTDAILLEDELNEMQWLQAQARASFVRRVLPTGVLDFLAGITTNTTQNELGVAPGSASAFNTFSTRGFKVNVHGFEVNVFGNNSSNDSNTITLDQPPAQNVTVSLSDSARDDLVLLEAWFESVGGYSGPVAQYGGVGAQQLNNDLIDPRVGSETTRRVQLKWRIRVIDGVDFATHPEGMKTKNLAWDTKGARVTPQGPNLTMVAYDSNNPVITQLHQLDATIDTNFMDKSDVGLFVAGDGTNNSQIILKTYNGYIYAMPLFRVRRRNTQPWNVDTNPLGGRGYPGNMIVSQAVSTGQTTIYVTAVDPNLQVGDAVNVWGNTAHVLSINTTNNSIVIDAPAYAANTGATLAIVGATSDRPDGLFNNIIDATDIVDLRHQVATNYDYNGMMAKNMNTLLHGNLSTMYNPKYTRSFAGLQPFADDINTLLLCHFDGTFNGVSNGAVVNSTSSPGVTTPLFAPGVAGQGFYVPVSSGTKVGVQYTTAAFNPSTSPLTAELFFKPGNWGGIATTANEIMDLFTLFDQGGNEVLSVYRDQYNTTNNTFTVAYMNGSGTMAYVPISGTQTLTPAINAGEWHYMKFINDPTNNQMVFQLNEVVQSGTSLPIENINVSSVLVGAIRGNGDFTVDEFRLSNVNRTGTPLPLNYSFLKGDRILNGPDATHFHFADDVALAAGLPNNPQGLTRVPMNVYNPTWLNNTLLKHYVGLGLTTGWTRLTNGFSDDVGESALPDGRMDGSAEYVWLKVNELVDGTRSTFTVTVPANMVGKLLLQNGNFSALVHVTTMGTLTTMAPTAINVNGNTVQFTLTNPPTVGSTVQFVVFAGDTHVHYIPSTRGYEIHGWGSDSFTIQYLDNPATAPSLAAVNISGGSLANGTTYYVRYTYTTPYGETLPSPEASVTLPNGFNAISATANTLPGGATGVKWYVSTSTNTETYNSTSTSAMTNIVAISAIGAAALPVVSSAQLTSPTMPFTRDTMVGQINVVNCVRMTLPSTQGVWLVPSAGYLNTTAGGPSVNIPSWSVTDTSGTVLSLPNDNAAVTFSGNLPVGTVVEVYYEYVYVPQIGDQIKIYYKHSTFQGLLSGQQQAANLINGKLLSEMKFLVTTEGSGKVDSLHQTGNIYRLNRNGAAVANLPLAANKNITALLKGDSLETFASVTTEFTSMMFVGNSEPAYNPYDNPWYVPGRSVLTIRTSTTQTGSSLFTVTGEPQVTTEGRADFLLKNLITTVPTLGAMYALVRDNGRIRMAVVTTYNTGQNVTIATGWDGSASVSNANLFELIGRPLIAEELCK